jgi:hypothetical protein
MGVEANCHQTTTKSEDPPGLGEKCSLIVKVVKRVHTDDSIERRVPPRKLFRSALDESLINFMIGGAT